MNQLKDMVPLLETENLQQTIDFYTQLLGFSINGSYGEGDNLTWVSLQKDQVCIMFSSRFHTTKDKPVGMSGSLYIYPNNLEKLWVKLKDSVMIDWPLQEFHYGMKEFAIFDNNGYRLIFGQEVTDQIDS